MIEVYRETAAAFGLAVTELGVIARGPETDAAIWFLPWLRNGETAAVAALPRSDRVRCHCEEADAVR